MAEVSFLPSANTRKRASASREDKDCDTYNEYICIYGPEIVRYCFSSNSDVGLVENVAENIRGKKEFAKFRIFRYLSYLYFCNADVSNRGDIGYGM